MTRETTQHNAEIIGFKHKPSDLTMIMIIIIKNIYTR